MDRPILVSLDRRLAPLDPRLITALAGLLALALGVIEFSTGAEISFSIFYVLPVSLAAWYAGLSPGVLVALLSAATWLAADRGGGATYSSSWIPLWNTVVRLGHFLIVARLVSVVRERLDFEAGRADTDPLTGLRNSRAFLESLEAEQSRASRYEHPFSLAYLDLDDFKHVNDRYGHDAGNRLLKEIGSALASAVRRTDRVGRLGGDEFAVLLPETDAAAARRVLEKIHRAVLSIDVGGTWRVGASLGGVTFATAPTSAEAALKAADALMYEAKRHGKNRLVHRER